jgi:hypothetical protein
MRHPVAVIAVVGVAKTHRRYEVRKQAMSWLGQSGDPRALAFFEDVLRRSRPAQAAEGPRSTRAGR